MLIKRDRIDEISKYLDDHNIVVLHGARQVGKTSIMQYLIAELKQVHSHVFYHDLEDFRYLEQYNQDLDSILKFWKSLGINENQKNYVFVDEIQCLNNPSSFLKLTHDHCPFIKLIVSGSSSFAIKSKFKDSLVGRTVDFEIFGLTFREFLRFKNVSLSLENTSDFTSRQLKEYWQEFNLFGTYPGIVLEDDPEKKERYLAQIISTYIEKDIRNLANIRDLQKFNHLIRLLAEQAGQLVNVSELANSLKMAEVTINEHLFILENTYVIRRIYPYYKNIRSELTKMPKIYFEDTGILNLLKNKTLLPVLDGAIFENACFNHLRKKFAVKNINFWRTNTKKEVDFIVQSKQLLPIEIKLNFKGKKDLKNLKYFLDNYSEIPQGYVCCLGGEKSAEQKNVRVVAPWEL